MQFLKQNIWRLAVVLSFLIIIQGCATRPTTIDSVDSKQFWIKAHQTFPHNSWQLKGKIAFIAKKRQSADIYWNNRESSFNLKLTTFIGSSILDVRQENDQLILIADDKTYLNSDAIRIITDVTGLDVPLVEVMRWITLLIPANKIVFTENGLPASFSPSKNWQIRYQNFTQVESWYLPSSIDIYSPRGRIKLKITEWVL